MAKVFRLEELEKNFNIFKKDNIIYKLYLI